MQRRRKFNGLLYGLWLVKESVILELRLELWHPVKKNIFAAQGRNRETGHTSGLVTEARCWVVQTHP